MAKVSISEAARLAGVSRGTFYKTYLNKGVVSVSKDASGKKCIETSELLRVFGSLKGDTSEQVDSGQVYTGEQVQVSPTVTPDTSKDIEIKMLREQLAKAEQREEWLQKKVDDLTGTLKLLEHKPSPGFSLVKLWNDLWK